MQFAVSYADLYDAAHEAGVAEVDEAPQPRGGVLAEAEAPRVLAQQLQLPAGGRPARVLGAQTQVAVVLAGVTHKITPTKNIR